MSHPVSMVTDKQIYTCAYDIINSWSLTMSNKDRWSRKRAKSASIACARKYRYNQDSNEEEIALQHPVPRSLESSVCTSSSDPVLQREDISEETEDPRDVSLRLPAVFESSDEDSESDCDEYDSDECEPDDDVIYKFDYDKASECYEEWMSSVSRDNKRMMGILLRDRFVNHFKMLKGEAAKEAADIVGVDERTLRGWHKEYYSNKGNFKEDARGKYERYSIINDEHCRKKALEWVRSNACRKGIPVMTGADFLQWVNYNLLPIVNLPTGYPRQISIRTARNWLHELGFSPTSHKKGVYIDGHERPDVVSYRKLFIRKMEILGQTHQPPPSCSDNVITENIGDPSAKKKLVLIFHDESIYHSNEDQGWQWSEEGKITIKPKGLGRGLMVSDFIDEYNGFLHLTADEFAQACQSHTDLPSSTKARCIVKYGANQEGYWNSDKFICQVDVALRISKIKYPAEDYNVVWLFDQSSGHCAYSDDALNVKKMNAGPAGKQPQMRDTTNPLTGMVQKMVDDNGIPKGMRQVLRERGINITNMTAPDMRKVLESHHDFKYEKTRVEHLLTKHGHRVFFIPKYHCELNPIERVWGHSKKYTRAHCNYSFRQLEDAIEPALDTVSVDLIRKFFRKARDFMKAYREDVPAGPALYQTVKKYKSHRRVPENL